MSHKYYRLCVADRKVIATMKQAGKNKSRSRKPSGLANASSARNFPETASYSGEYFAANGVLMFGLGLIVGAFNNDSHHHDCYPSAA